MPWKHYSVPLGEDGMDYIKIENQTLEFILNPTLLDLNVTTSFKKQMKISHSSLAPKDSQRTQEQQEIQAGSQ